MISNNAEYQERLDSLKKLMDDTLLKYGEEASNRHFIHASVWRLELADGKERFLGRCSYRTRLIELNIDHVKLDSFECVKDTLLHECAHALCGVVRRRDGKRSHHGKEWKAWARRLGCNPASTNHVDREPVDVVTEAIREKRKWIIVSIDDDGTVTPWCHAGRRLKNLAYRAMPKAREATDGKLWHIPTEIYRQHSSCNATLRIHATR